MRGRFQSTGANPVSTTMPSVTYLVAISRKALGAIEYQASHSVAGVCRQMTPAQWATGVGLEDEGAFVLSKGVERQSSSLTPLHRRKSSEKCQGFPRHLTSDSYLRLALLGEGINRLYDCKGTRLRAYTERSSMF